ncbi:MAG: DMT family transporter [Flavobacteriales bacterium]|nr:DMT family transporter [Flavobacteriales bacterium]
MALVILSALLSSAFFLLFKAFQLRRITLFPAIAVNYVVAFVLGLAWSRPWSAGDLGLLWWPAAVEGAGYFGLFLLMGTATQRVGVSPVTVAAKLSLALTVAATVLVFREQLVPMAWAGIVLAVLGVGFSSWGGAARGARGWWLLPVIFLGNSFTDVFLNAVQRTRLTPLTEAAFTTLVFGFAALFSLLWLAFRADRGELRKARTWAGGALLGGANFGSLLLLLSALAGSGLPASIVFPLLNTGVILFGAAGAMLLFRENPRPVQWAGIACSMASLLMILAAFR